MGIFDRVRGVTPRRAAFNLSHSKTFTCDMGQLIPTCVMETLPGDHFQIAVELVIRMNPQLAPMLHEVDAFLHYFFIPNRLTWPGDESVTSWQKFITGGMDGQDASVMPTWVPTGGNVTNDDGTVVADNGVGSLWDFFGLPVGVIPAGLYPVAFLRRAYNMVFNQFYRDENQDAEVSLDSVIVLNRRWEKDWFTSALPWQQRGVAPALPITIGGASSAVFPANFNAAFGPSALSFPAVGAANQFTMSTNSVSHAPFDANTKAGLEAGTASGNAVVTKANLDNNVVSGAGLTAASFNMSDLRLASATQKWMERNARSGARYIEELLSHFNVAPRDERLQRVEYVGGCRLPVIVSEVLQTSATGLTGGSTPQGGMAGHALAAGRDACASYRAVEHGMILGIMSVMPRTKYHQGVLRHFVKTTKLDYFWPELGNLSEQAVLQGEIFADGNSAHNTTVFGYQGKWNELRNIPSQVMGLMRPGVAGSLAFWNLCRTFSVAPGLNSAFLKAVPRKDFLAAPSQPALIVDVANIVKAVRPIPLESDPGYVDHDR